MTHRDDDCPVILLTVPVRVTDPDKLRAFATRRLQEAWDGDAPESLAEAVYEAMIGANMNPDNAELGIEIISVPGLDAPYRQIAGPREAPHA